MIFLILSSHLCLITEIVSFLDFRTKIRALPSKRPWFNNIMLKAKVLLLRQTKARGYVSPAHCVTPLTRAYILRAGLRISRWSVRSQVNPRSSRRRYRGGSLCRTQRWPSLHVRLAKFKYRIWMGMRLVMVPHLSTVQANLN